MSFISSIIAYQNNTNARLNAEQNLFNNSQQLTGMMANPYSHTQPLRKEQQLAFGSLQSQLMLKIADAQEESLKKQRDKNIKRTFNYFA